MMPWDDEAGSYWGQTWQGLALAGGHWTGHVFEGCQFIGGDFTQAVLRRCQFIDCQFTGCNLSLVAWPASQLRQVQFVGCKLLGVDWTQLAWPVPALGAPLSLRECLLDEGNFFGLPLTDLVLSGSRLRRADLREADLRRADCQGCDFAGALFGHTDLRGADFGEASDYDIDPLNNRLQGARFSRFEALRLLAGLGIELVD
ncbi:pentapeptide repeat-containing protein [Pseudaeromonas sp. ZJS20]|uniref:pentapeptide repeat-containing protein n=1 Tax=Pseudaeromonas aegiceratis TaxID=3153928 RepID=UPI00390CBABA